MHQIKEMPSLLPLDVNVHIIAMWNVNGAIGNSIKQIMQIIGTLSAALVLGLVLDILHSAYTIGSPDFPAPQATLMKSVAEGVFDGNLPWGMVKLGAILV